MAIRNIVTKESEQLRKKCRTVVSFDEKLHILLDDMYDTMVSLDGVGIAAPQVGILKNVIVVDLNDGERLELINPLISFTDGTCQELEGCLSCPYQWGLVTRPKDIELSYVDRHNKHKTLKANGFLARVIQHEVDHLKGVLFIDIVDKFLNDDEVDEYMKQREK